LRETSVVRYRKKIVVFLITVTLGSGVLLVCSARPATDGTELENSPVLASPQVRAKSKVGSLFANDPNFSSRPDGSAGNQELFFKMMLSVLFVVALGAAAIYVSKKFLPKITNLSGKEIRIAETVHLGPRKAVHLLEIGNRRLLIGSTNENITRLADLTSAFADLSAQEGSRLAGTQIDNN
jgi:flagellar biosynthetic protein FliO